MRVIIEIAVLLYMLSLVGQSEQDGFRDGINTCSEANHGRI
jgi:hypothetical protein